jgi:hypothetical protein
MLNDTSTSRPDPANSDNVVKKLHVPVKDRNDCRHFNGCHDTVVSGYTFCVLAPRRSGALDFKSIMAHAEERGKLGPQPWADCKRPRSAPTIVIGNAVGLRENLLSWIS